MVPITYDTFQKAVEERFLSKWFCVTGVTRTPEPKMTLQEMNTADPYVS